MDQNILTFTFKKPIKLFGLTDVHIGAKEHDAKKFQQTLTLLKNDPDAYCFFNGDNFEFIPPDYGISTEGQTQSVDVQIDSFRKLLKSLGKKVLFFRLGNHENRAWKLTGVDLGTLIQQMTNVPFVKHEMTEIHINVGGRKTRIVSSHGIGASPKKVLTNMQLTFPGADLYFTGHSHEKYNNSSYLTVRTETGKEIMTPIMECVGGSFVGWADYARGLNRRPTQTGCYVFGVSSKGIRIIRDIN